MKIQERASERKTDWFYMLAFGIPVVLLVILYAAAGYYPFGDKTILVWDMDTQYVSFFSWMCQVFKQQSVDSLWYSLSVSLGGSTAGLMGYYLLSPFNLLLLPFPTEWLPVGIQLVTMVKLGFCGVTMYHYLKKRFGQRSYGTVLFAVMYALMGYTVVYQPNIMWLDGVLLLPVILLNVWYLVDQKRAACYPVWICLTVITGFYIAYMVILFAMVYYWIEQGVREEKGSWQEMLKHFVRLVGLTLLGVGMSGIIFAPVLYEIFSIGRGDGGVWDSLKLLFHFDKRMVMLPMKFLVGAYDREQLVRGLPNIYVSLLCLPFWGLYFMDRRNVKRSRWSYLAGIGLLLLSFTSEGMNRIWQGFTYTSGSGYRYSFCLSFLFLVVGYCQYVKIRDTGKLCELSVQILTGEVLVGLWGLWTAYEQFAHQIYEFSSIWKWLLTGIVLLCGVVGVLWLGRQTHISIYHGLFSLILGFELVMNMVWCMEGFTYTSLNDYQEYVVTISSAYESLKEENDGNFFRMEAELRESFNDALLIGYPSITHYSSTVRDEVAQYALENDLLPEGMGRQATLFRDYNVSTEQLGRYAGKYLLTYRLPENGDMDGWIIRQEEPFYILENADFKPLCYLADETASATVDIRMKNSADITVTVSGVGRTGDVLETSIPYCLGWSVTVDGQKCEPKIEDLFIRLELEPGDHEIVMRYHQPLLLSGILVSMVSLGVYLLILKRKKRSKLLREGMAEKWSVQV